MTVDREVVQRRAQEIVVFCKELEKLSKISKKDFLANSERQYAVMHLLQLAIEVSISLGNHIVARMRFGIPENYQDVFSLLEKGGVLSKEFAKEMMKMARFRNKLVHIYWQMDLEQIYNILTTRLGDFEKFLKQIKQKFR